MKFEFYHRAQLIYVELYHPNNFMAWGRVVCVKKKGPHEFIQSRVVKDNYTFQNEGFRQRYCRPTNVKFVIGIN